MVPQDYLARERLLVPDTLARYGVEQHENGIYIPVAGNARLYVPHGDPKIKWALPFPKGTSMPLFAAPGALMDATLLLTEGEFDAMLADQMLQLSTVSGTGGASTWLDDWSRLLAGKTVTILYDADVAGSSGAQKAALSLMRAGANVRIASWPAGSPEGFDVTDWFKTGGTAEELRAIIEAAVVFSPPSMARRAGEFITIQVEAMVYLVEKIWPEEAIGFVSGQPKVFKSFLSMDMGFAVATGGLFLGYYQAPRARRVLLIQLESSRAAFRDRLERMGTRFGGVPEKLFVISNEPILLEDKTWVEKITNEIALVRPELLILDPLASLTSGDENSAQEMGALVRLLRTWRDRFNTAICVVHHTVKDGSGRRAGQKLRGSGALYGAAEVVVAMERPDDDVPRVAVRIELKEADSPKPFLAEFDGLTADLRILTEQRLLSTGEQIREFLSAHDEATVADIASACNIKPNQAREAVRAIRGVRLRPGTGMGNRPALYYLDRAMPIHVGRPEQSEWLETE